MRKLIFVFAIVGALTGGSAARAKGMGQTSAPPADSGYQSRLDLANQLIEVNGGRKQMEALMNSMASLPMQSLAASLPENQRPLVGKIIARQKTMMADLFPSIINISVKAYASTFTEQELRDLLTFQETPSGQAMIHKMPALNAKMMGDLMPLILEQMPKMMNTVVAEVCNEQHCTVEQRQTITAALAKALPGQPRAAQPATPAS